MRSPLISSLCILLILGVVSASGVTGGFGLIGSRSNSRRISSDHNAVASVVSASTKAASRTASTPLQVFVQTILDARRHLTAAAVARSTSIFLMYPADVFKTRLQMKQANAFRLTGLFNGVTGSLVGQVPYGVLTFGSYEMYKSFLLDRLPSVPPIFKYAMGTFTCRRPYESEKI